MILIYLRLRLWINIIKKNKLPNDMRNGKDKWYMNHVSEEELLKEDKNQYVYQRC